ncbi:hypothetical protein CHS0354_025750 [Potamilus streckersoni]|uniref:Uncharacterized protein n=1 Tax=Potamilus streckersoni TaxID=2493646 RepID=A0AAE0RUQ7_9BIVA|nr:hypothetical protein CHS0354_025750 [Potamilus streckersoni]
MKEDQHQLEKRSACSDFLLHTYSVQMCSRALGMLNGTIYSQADVCSIFDETLNCVQKSVEGGTCSHLELETMYKHTATLAGLTPLIQRCHVSRLNDSFCESTQRLGELIFVACNPYFYQMSMFPSIKCSMFSEVLSCMQRVYSNEGSTCTLDVLSSTVISFGELSQADWLPVENFRLCKVYESFSNTSLCRSDSRLLDILFYVGKQYLESLNQIPVSFQCQGLELVTNTTLLQINILKENCVKADLIRAMMSTMGKERFQTYPSIHINECVYSHTE